MDNFVGNRKRLARNKPTMPHKSTANLMERARSPFEEALYYN